MPCNVLAPAPTAASQRMKQHDTVLTDVECYGLKAANMKSMPCQLETDKFESQSLGVVLENHDEYRNETKDDGQVQYESLQTHEAELRRLEEEKALYQGSVQIKQKIRVCRQQIFSAMQRLQSLKEDQTKIENMLLTQANTLRQNSKAACSPVRFKLGLSTELKHRRELLQRIDDIRVMRIEVERSLEEAQKVANAAIIEENRIDFLLNANAQRKLLLQRLATLRDVWKEDLCCSRSEQVSSEISHDLRHQVMNQGTKIPVVLRVKSMSDHDGKFEELMSTDSECNPPAVEELSIISAHQCHGRVDSDSANEQFRFPEIENQSHELDEGKVDLEEDKSADVEFLKPVLNDINRKVSTGSIHLSENIQSKQVVSTINWDTFHSSQEGEGEGLISCQLSTDGSVDLMSSLSVTEGIISLSSSMTSTNSSYTPRRHRMLGQIGMEGASKPRKHHAADTNGNIKSLDRRKMLDAASSFIANEKLELHHMCRDSTNPTRDLADANKFSGTGMVLSSELVASGELVSCDPELAPMSISMDEVHILYERAMTAEYENKRLRRKIEALERECTFLRSSTDMAAKGILEVFADLNDTELARDVSSELKYTHDSPLIRFSRSPCMLHQASLGCHLIDGPSESNSSAVGREPFESISGQIRDMLNHKTHLSSTAGHVHEKRTSGMNENSKDISSISRHAGYFVDRLMYSTSQANQSGFEESTKLPTSSLFFKRLSDITSNCSETHMLRSSTINQQRNSDFFTDFVRPYQLPQVSTLSASRDSSAAQHLKAFVGISGRAPVEAGNQQYFLRREGEEFSMGPNALEESIYDLHATFAASRSNEVLGDRIRADPKNNWQVNAQVKEQRDHVEASFFMIV